MPTFPAAEVTTAAPAFPNREVSMGVIRVILFFLFFEPVSTARRCRRCTRIIFASAFSRSRYKIYHFITLKSVIFLDFDIIYSFFVKNELEFV